MAAAWSLANFDDAPARMQLTFTFVRRGGRVVVADVQRAQGARLPIWLLGPLAVRTTSRTLVAATNIADAELVDRQLRVAVKDLRRVLTDWHGGLVSYVPANGAQLAPLLTANPGRYREVAAVTTTVDGSRRADAPVAIVVNPPVFDRLGAIGRHVVISHEATHAATRAASVNMPLWLAEGFADYVGIGAVDVPLSVSAGSALRHVELGGVPPDLPDGADFATGGAGLEQAYELSWLAVRLIAEEYGEGRLVTFYEAVVADPRHLDRAFRTQLGTTRERFTTQWRRHLTVLADAQ